MTAFSELALLEPLLRAVAAEGYTVPTPIQLRAIPLLLAGRDVLGAAQTGTGKTAAFALPILQHLVQHPAPPGRPLPRALVLSPTRELAAQIGASFASYGRFVRVRHAVIFGGVGEAPQIAALRHGVEVLVATPGRLLDLHGRGYVDLRGVEKFVLDEADRMLDMGFIHDVRRVLRALPAARQNLLFSATLPASITQLAASFLREPVRVEVAPPATLVATIDQSVRFVAKADKPACLVALLRDGRVGRALVFTRTKHGADKLAKHLGKAGIPAGAIHGNKAQNARTRALEAFRRGDVPILIATDIASRGIDVDDVTHVFNYEIPNIPDSYVHRIGRTARAGQTGIAVSLCDPDERPFLRDIERTTGVAIRVESGHPGHGATSAAPDRPPAAPRPMLPRAPAPLPAPLPPAGPPARPPLGGGWRSPARSRFQRRRR